MPTPIVIDLSHHNTIPESLVPAANAGIVGVIHKATEGGSYVDGDVDSRWYLTKEAGMLWGLYHFMRPGDQKAHAKHFVNVATANGDQYTLLAADHEDAAVSLTDLKTWLAEVERLTGRKPIIYSGHVLKDQLKGKADATLSTYLLWLAQYSSSPTLPPGFSSTWLWQYSDKGSVPGVQAPTDVNAGDAADVKARWSGGAAQPIPPEPQPAPSPEPAEVVIDIATTPGVVVTVRVNDEVMSVVA
jgi:lysozyme